MNRRRIALLAWVLLLVAFSFAAGFTVPPTGGVADASQDEDLGARPLRELLATSAGRTDVYDVTPAMALHSDADLLVVVAPEREPFPAETRALQHHMERGGTLMLFIASDLWNPFLADHGMTVHGNLLIPTANATSERLVEVPLPEDLGGGRLMLPNATALTDPGPGVSTVVPDRDMVLDINGNGTLEPEADRAGSFPVLGQTGVGDGRLVVVTSIEAVLGTGIERNLDALSRLVEATSGGTPVALDTSTHARGFADAARAPAQAVAGVLHSTLAGIGLVLVLTAAVLFAVPSVPRHERSHTALDDPTPVTKEVMDRGRA